MSQISFLILSGSYIFRTGLRSLLEEMEITQKVYLAEDIDKALKIQADILFLDTLQVSPASLPAAWTEESHKPVLVGLLPHTNGELSEHRGIWDHFLDLSLTKSELLEEIRRIIRESGYQEHPAPREEKLSEREKTILRLVALGHTNRDIAEKLFISTHTVITHRKNITRKIGIKTVSGLTVYALLNHLVEMDEIQEQTG